MNKRVITISIILSTIGYFAVAHNTATEKRNQLSRVVEKPDSQKYLSLMLKTGDKFADLYSRTIAITGDSLKPLIFRASGSSNYTIMESNPVATVVTGTDNYDGIKPYTYTMTMRLNGINTLNGKDFSNTSASGLLYNEVIWGKPTVTLKEGDFWKVKINSPWELGGIGEQIVTVISFDTSHQTITLKREGSGEGFFDHDSEVIEVTALNGKHFKVSLKPGKCYWTGFTTFKNAIVIADELMVTRSVKLAVGNLSYSANERQYILLNLMAVN